VYHSGGTRGVLRQSRPPGIKDAAFDRVKYRPCCSTEIMRSINKNHGKLLRLLKRCLLSKN
jgi:hypothetical protein